MARLRTYVSLVDWQEIAALIIVALTAGLFLRRRFARRRFSFQDGSPCGCSAPRSETGGPSIVYHARKGEAPRVTVRMK